MAGRRARLPAEAVSDDWHTLRLGPPVRVDGRTYLCSGIRLVRGDNAGDTLYILYPESLWRDALWEAVWPSISRHSLLILLSRPTKDSSFGRSARTNSASTGPG